jgi:S1-C subfamily serine protease
VGQRGFPPGPAGAQLPAAGQGPATPATGPATGEAGAEEEDQFTLTREELQTYVRNLSTILGQMELAPHLDAERKPDGLQILSLQPQSVAAQRGLRQGDIVKMLYDEPVTNVSEIAPLARKILDDDPAFIEVVVERDGDEESLIYEVR